MATNNKHLDSQKYQKALSLDDRLSIDKIISSNRDSSGKLSLTLNSISDMLEKDPTTISKEVKKHRSEINLSIPNFKYALLYCKSCANQRECVLKAQKKGIEGPCEGYVKYVCKFLNTFPWVCNGCKKKGFCSSPKSYYSPTEADNDYKYVLTDSRIGISLEVEEYKEIDSTISNGLKRGQSIAHICKSNDLNISISTAYAYLKNGYLTAKQIDARRIVKLKIKGGKKHHNSLILKKLKEGKNYNDFIKHLEANPGLIYTQMDTVEGKKGGKVVLSLKLVSIQFQFYFLLENKEAKSVVNKLNEIQQIIGIENYKKIFGTILTDNGSEFTDIQGIFSDPDTGEIRTNLFFCDAMASYQKGSCENSHERFRYVLPKEVSFDNLTQKDFDLITSHINSYKIKSIDFSCAIEKFYAFFGKEILDKLNISLIPANDVLLKPELIKK